MSEDVPKINWKMQSLKILGLCFMAHYFIFVDHSEKLELKWIAIGMLVMMLSTLALYFSYRFLARVWGQECEEPDGDRMYYLMIKHPWWILLIPGEDGLFFLPAIYLGFDPLGTFLLALIFGLLHVPMHGFWPSVCKILPSWLLMVFVLPYSGLLNWTIAHLLIDLLAASPMLSKKERQEVCARFE